MFLRLALNSERHIDFSPLELFAVMAIICSSVFTAGCSSGISSKPQETTETTSVAVLASSTANGRLFQFSATINSLTLTSRTGNTVSLLNGPLYVEFIHLNGIAEPLQTLNVSSGDYTSAAVSLGPTGFTCGTLGPNGVVASHVFGESGSVPKENAKVNLSSPLTISGVNMVLKLDLQASKSANYSSCYTTGIEAAFIFIVDLTRELGGCAF